MAETIDVTEYINSVLNKSSLDPIAYQYFHNLENRTIVLNSVIDSDIVETLYLPLREFEKDDSNEPVTLIINCDGGSVCDSFFIAEYISMYKKPLNMICTGSASSMATVLFAAGGNNPNVVRYAFPSSFLLIHDGYVGLNTAESKTAEDVMEFNKQLDLRIRDFIVKNTAISTEAYDSHSRKQWFILADEAKKLGLIDKIYGVDA